MLKLDVAFLYDLLGASQEHKIKPKKFAQTDIDEVIIGHTNEPEYKKLQNNEFMEALPRPHGEDRHPVHHAALATRSRSTRRTSTPRRSRGKHIAPHTLEMAAMWAVLTRLEEPKNANLTLLQKLKLYNGKTLPGFTEDNIKELRKEATREGMRRHLPALHPGQDLQRAGARIRTRAAINPFMVLNELEAGLQAPLADHQRGAAQATTSELLGRREARSTRTS